MKKIVKLSESDLTKIVKCIVKEQDNDVDYVDKYYLTDESINNPEILKYYKEIERFLNQLDHKYKELTDQVSNDPELTDDEKTAVIDEIYHYFYQT